MTTQKGVLQTWSGGCTTAPTKHQTTNQRKNGPTCLQNSWAVFASTSLLSLSRAAHKLFSAHRTLDMLKVDAAHLGW
jgi:hypothetical protein